MAGTAQTGLGPGTVALSWKVFIAVMFFAHERLDICTAQPGVTLPEALQGNLDGLIRHLCPAGCEVESSRLNCEHDQQLPNPLCFQICNTGVCKANCWNTAVGTSLCRGNQDRICGYSNADVCQNNNGDKRICVYTRYPPSAFCVCQGTEEVLHGQGKPSTRYISCDSLLPAGSQATTAQATTTEATTTAAATSQVILAQAAKARGSTGHQPTNVVGIVFGSLFALLLPLVIIGAVVLCLLRHGRLPSFVKQTANPDDLSSVELKARNSTRALPPEPPVPSTSMEYSYANDHIPATPGVKGDGNLVGPTYCSVGEDDQTASSPRYVLDGQRKRPTPTELDKATDNVTYFVLNRDDGDVETSSPNGGGQADEVEVTDSSTGVQSKEGIGKEYTPLVLTTGDPTSRTEQSGNEVAVSKTSSKVTSPIDSPTKGLSNGDTGTYFPLIKTAEPKSYVEQSGYEVAKIPTPESRDATSPTGAQSKSGDDNTYTSLVRTEEPKSQKEHSGYDTPIIPKPGLAADSDATSHYDHIDRKREKDTKGGALSTADVDDYQLVNSK